MDIIYSYSSRAMILYNKYKMYYQPINPPNYPLNHGMHLISNYVIKHLQRNINCNINHVILTLPSSWWVDVIHSNLSTIDWNVAPLSPFVNISVSWFPKDIDGVHNVPLSNFSYEVSVYFNMLNSIRQTKRASNMLGNTIGSPHITMY